MNIIKRQQTLPDNIEDLQKFILIGTERLNAYKAQLRAVKKASLAKEIKDRTLEDSQRMGTALLLAESKMGELLENVANPTASRAGRRQLPQNISHKQSHEAQQLSKHKDIIEEVIAEAEEHEEIPTKRDVIRRINKKKSEAIISDLKEKKVVLPDNKFHTIVIDPPWEMKKIDRECRINQVGFDYPTMSIEKIINIPVANISHENCHIYLWTTQRYLPEAFNIIAEWGFSYLVTMVWHKNGGFQPVGLPQYNCEFVLLGRKGNLPFIDLKDFKVCFNGKRKEHSRKPDEFYDLIKRVSPEPRIDIFSREKRKGFSQYGNEPEKF